MGRIKATCAAVATAGLVAAAVFKARTWTMTWGASPEELLAQLPGDSLVPVADIVATRAITVHAPASEVWPWLVQVGQNKAGFYSYDALENLLGLNIHSADRIMPQFQQVAVGDPVNLADGVALRIAELVPGSALVLAGDADMIGGSAPPFEFSWAFALQPVRDGSAGGTVDATRLIVRERYAYVAGWAPLMVEPTQWVSFVMSAKMLRGIKARAEAAARAAR